jgi:hypothetical protein
MAPSLKTLIKIALLTIDEGIDEATRAVASTQLAAAVSFDPALVQEAVREATAQLKAHARKSGRQAPPTQGPDDSPPWSDVEDERERERVFNLKYWSPSTRSPSNLCLRLRDVDHSLITLFTKAPGEWRWSLNSETRDVLFSRGAFSSERDAVADVWAVITRIRQGRKT